MLDDLGQYGILAKMKSGFRRICKALRLFPHQPYRSALFRGVGGAIEHEAILFRLAKEGVRLVVDIGANVGQFALVARRCVPAARIDSFEPLAGPARVFRTIFDQDSQVILHQCAIGPVPTFAAMHVSAAQDSSSLLPIGALQKEIFPRTGEIGQERVRVAPLEAEIEVPESRERALLKIDVQGYELETLKGCESLLGRFHAVYVEASFVVLYEGQGLAHEVIDFLHTRGFALAGIFNPTYSPDAIAVQGDFLFLRRAVVDP